MEIPANKKRLPVLMYSGLAIGAILVLFIIRVWRQPEDPGSERTNYLFLLMALLSAVGYMTLYAFLDYTKLMFGKNVGVYVSEDGIRDNLSIFSVGMVKWADIRGLILTKTLKTGVLVVHVEDPELLIKRQGLLKRKVLLSYLRRYGSPIVIAQTRIDFDILELKNILDKKRAEAGKTK